MPEMYDKAISVKVFSGRLNGLMMAELSNWDGRVYKINYDALLRFGERPDAQNTGVYFLIGQDRDLLGHTVYIGEAECMLDRLKQHISRRDEWSECIAVISKDNHLNKAHVKNLEYVFYTEAKTAAQYRVLNSATPTESTVSEFDQAMLVEFADRVKLIVRMLGYRAFISNLDAPPPPETVVYYIKGAHDAEGKGVLTTDGFTVFKDSRVSSGVTPSSSDGIKDMRKRLTDDGVIDGESFIFQKNYLFTSPSTAAQIVLGRSANGRTEWKDENGRVLNAVEEERIRGASRGISE